MTCQTIGRPPISTSAFGITSVRSRRRVPRPPQRIRTGGVLVSATGDGRQDRHLVAVCQLGLESVREADVLAGDVDVDEPAKVAVLRDPLAQAVVGFEDGVK